MDHSQPVGLGQTQRDQPVVFCLDAEEVEWAFRRAFVEAERFSGKPSPYNNGNSALAHFVGKLGEMATAGWLLSEGFEVDAVFGDFNSIAECDLVAQRPGGPALRIEVKSWQDGSSFKNFAGSIASQQLSSISTKCDVLVWVRTPKITWKVECGAATPPDFVLPGVALAGWSLSSEIPELGREFGEGSWRGGRQLIAHDWHAMSELLALTSSILADS